MTDDLKLSNEAGITSEQWPHGHFNIVSWFVGCFEDFRRQSKHPDFNTYDFAQLSDRRFVHQYSQAMHVEEDVAGSGFATFWTLTCGSDIFNKSPMGERARLILEQMLNTAGENDIDLSILAQYGDVKLAESVAESAATLLRLIQLHGIDQRHFEDQIGRIAMRFSANPFGRELAENLECECFA